MNSSVDKRFITFMQQGAFLQQQYRLKEAKWFFEQALKIYPNNVDALQLMGLLFAQIKDYSHASEYLSKAIQIDPGYFIGHNNYGIILSELRRYEEALASYNQAIDLKSDYAEAYSNRGTLFIKLRRYEEALASYNQAIDLKPDYAEAFNNRGNCFKELRRYEEALASYNQAIDLKPDYAEAFNNRGNCFKELRRYEEALASYKQAIDLKPDYAEAFNNRGIALAGLSRYEEALASYKQAIDLKPDYAEAFNNRGIALAGLSRYEEALASYKQAIDLKPDYAEAFNNRGIALAGLSRYEEALASYNQAISFDPDYAEAYSNRGNLLVDLKSLDDAYESFQKALAIDENNVNANWNFSLLNLIEGKLIEGWKGYEWRWKNKNSNKESFSQPLWLGGQPLKNKTILLYAEQGLGDIIQFCRYVPLVAKLGAKVILEVPSELEVLLKSLEGVGQTIRFGDKRPVFDYQCPLLSLPLAFKTDLSNIPPPPRISIDLKKGKYWQAKLGQRTKKRVGVVWSSMSNFKHDGKRSLTLEKFLKALPPDGYEYICLQKEIKECDQEIFKANRNIKFFGGDLNDLTDTSALIDCVDLVISTCTSVPHLSASLGKDTWLLLSFVPDWRWFLDRGDSPWYPSMQLFRQEKINDWSGVLQRVKLRLTNLR
ncbi:tetratricopeptide repeat protein [Polynucleobacter paneuropaeus]|nr:tetratricopeptide repeat protein [Polynucleobacter paneuropaeus]